LPEASYLLSPRVCLTLLVPRALEDRVVDWLLVHSGSAIEFSVHAVAARGPLVHLAVSEERVQGYADRVELKLIIANGSNRCWPKPASCWPGPTAATGCCRWSASRPSAKPAAGWPRDAPS
jgi:hydrogenase maturation factor